ncbi:MAG: DUF4127 family protein [Selenomonadaceae bacterium]|nr:DUF4127 family protein [Selenomonadaceae bacterium]
MSTTKLFRVVACLLTLIFICAGTGEVSAKKKVGKEKILYIPHDNRPIVNKQTIEVLQKAGYQVVSPPDEILGGRENLGDPDLLWDWLNKNAKKDIKAAVISSDALIYGSLVGSRKHEFDGDEILARTDLFTEFRKKHKKMPLYVFGSIMRTPRTGLASGYEEPDYYRYYGTNIFRLTELMDKNETEGLTQREVKEVNFLQRLIPQRALEDWMGRREKNFNANKKLIDCARNKTFDYLLLGRDDNAPYSQTHNEGRKLLTYGEGIKTYQTTAGIDEIGLVLLTRAVNERTKNSPKIFVKYNWGRGELTIPSYSDESIDDSIRASIKAAGATLTDEETGADFILAVNTNPDGLTFEADNPVNTTTERGGTKYFADMVADYLDGGKKVIVADVAFANGSDNALMDQLRRRALLFNLTAYGGWNTATNSSGFALATGILSTRMTDAQIDELLLRRYLDDWAYQANVRKTLAAQLDWIAGDGRYETLDGKRDTAAEDCAQLLKFFAEHNLPAFTGRDNMKVKFPWNRMFEADISLGRR